MAFNEEDIRRVREASDLLEIVSAQTPVKQKGHDFWCCCPLHQEKTPSFKIDTASQLWHCFGCGEGGDVFAFIMKTEDMSFPDAVQYLADRAHIQIKDSGNFGSNKSNKTRLKQLCEAAADFYHLALLRSTDAGAHSARNYLSSRHFGSDIAKQWRIGYAPGNFSLVRQLSALGFSTEEMIRANVATERNGKAYDRFFNRIMFPVNDVSGDVIAFGGRVIGSGEPKYLNSAETPLFHKSNILYGLDKAKVAMADDGLAIIVEGYTDVIALHAAGIKNAVATLGTALTRSHIRLLSRHAKKRVVYLFDGDEAGQRAAERALSFLDELIDDYGSRYPIEVNAVVIPENLDPADFVAEKGADALLELIDASLPLIQFGIDRKLSPFDLSKPEQRSIALSEALSVLAPIKNSMIAKDYARQIAGLCHAREDDVALRLAKLKKASTNNSVSVPTTQAVVFDRSDNLFSASADASRMQGIKHPLDSNERNRRRFERSFLIILAQNPHLVSSYIPVLFQTTWHSDIHQKIADCIASTTEQNPQANTADIVYALSSTCPQAAGLLTGDAGITDLLRMNPTQSGAQTLALEYLAEELSLGEVDEQIQSLKSKLNASLSSPLKQNSNSNSENETLQDSEESLLKTIMALQRDCTLRRQKQKRRLADLTSPR